MAAARGNSGVWLRRRGAAPILGMHVESVCEACGNHSLEPLHESGAEALECSICGAVTGDDSAVNRILLGREAQARGFGVQIYPLARELDELGGVAVRQAEDGDSWAMTFPRIAMTCDKRGVRQLQQLMRSLALHQRDLRIRWVLQLELGDHLLYVLKPDFQAPPAQVAPQQIEDAIADSLRLGEFVAADRRLSWWKRD
jgi:hypothetical protein